MENLTLNCARTLSFVDPADITDMGTEMEKNNRALHEKRGKGNDFLGWVDLPPPSPQKSYQTWRRPHPC